MAGMNAVERRGANHGQLVIGDKAISRRARICICCDPETRQPQLSHKGQCGVVHRSGDPRPAPDRVSRDDTFRARSNPLQFVVPCGAVSGWTDGDRGGA